MGKAPKTVTKDGQSFFRNIPAEWRGSDDICGNWPMKSDALGVLPSQIEEASAHLAECGVPTSFTTDGTARCIVENRGHRNRILNALNMHDRNAGYGDRARGAN